MEAPSVTALLVAGYAVLLLVIAWGFDRMGEHSARRATSWRTGNFVYHEGKDAWQCHEDQWLFPAAFDPDKRVIRYVGTPAVCGQCPVKDECSPTPGPREVTRAVDPWPHSESGRFHRGISLCVAVIAVFMPSAMLIGAHRPSEVVVLGCTAGLALIIAVTYGRHLRGAPSNFPRWVPTETATPQDAVSAVTPDLDQILDRYSTRWGSDRRRVDLPTPTVRK
jgi:hypothetical protein